jgi:hypothetical protein
MQPTLVQPFHRDGWVYEKKVDGWRMVASTTTPTCGSSSAARMSASAHCGRPFSDKASHLSVYRWRPRNGPLALSVRTDENPSREERQMRSIFSFEWLISVFTAALVLNIAFYAVTTWSSRRGHGSGARKTERDARVRRASQDDRYHAALARAVAAEQAAAIFLLCWRRARA